MRCGDFDENGRYELKDFPGVYLDSSIYENVQMMTTEPYVTRDGEELVCRLYRTYDTYAIGYELRDTFRFTDTEVYWDLDYVYATDDVKERRERILHFVHRDLMSSIESVFYHISSFETYKISIHVKKAVGADGYFTVIELVYPWNSPFPSGYMSVYYGDTYVETKNIAFDIYYELCKVRKTRISISESLSTWEREGHVSYFADNPYFEELDYIYKY